MLATIKSIINKEHLIKLDFLGVIKASTLAHNLNKSG